MQWGCINIPNKIHKSHRSLEETIRKTKSIDKKTQVVYLCGRREKNGNELSIGLIGLRGRKTQTVAS